MKWFLSVNVSLLLPRTVSNLTMLLWPVHSAYWRRLLEADLSVSHGSFAEWETGEPQMACGPELLEATGGMLDRALRLSLLSPSSGYVAVIALGKAADLHDLISC